MEGPPGGVQVGSHAAGRISRRKARSPSVNIPCLQHMPGSTQGSEHKVLQRASSQRFPLVNCHLGVWLRGNLLFITSGLDVQSEAGREEERCWLVLG